MPCQVFRSWDFWFRSLKILAIYGHGGHDHVTKIILIFYQPRVSIYTNFVEIESPMLHAVLYGGNLGHVTKVIFFKNMSPLPKETPHKIWLWLTVCFQRCLKLLAIYIYIALGQGKLPRVIFLFHKHKSVNNLVICCKFFPLNDFATVFSFQMHRQPYMTLPNV